LSPPSEDRVPIDHPIRKRSRSSSEEYFDEDDPSSNTRNVDEDYSRRDRSFSDSFSASENQRQNAQVLVPSVARLHVRTSVP
jgi:hypothetical protein